MKAKQKERVKAILLTGLLLIFIPFKILHAEPPTEPSTVEKNVFKAKLERLKSHADMHPISVTDIISSLEDTLRKQIECPPSSEINKVQFKIITKHIKFDRNLMIGEESIPVEDTDIGWFQWTVTSKVTDGMKIITACNYIMLDSAIMVQQEADPPYGPIADEGLLYHELLHGQLVIDSIMNNESYQNRICSCDFDLSAADTEHEHIHDLESNYLKDLLKETGIEDPEVYILDPPAQKADGDGKFKLEIAEETILGDKLDISIKSYFPKGSNVMEGSLGLVFENGKIFITGMLIDKTKPGIVSVIIDPPAVFVFLGLEKTLHILPSSSVIPTMSQWGIIILALILLILGTKSIKSAFSASTKKVEN